MKTAISILTLLFLTTTLFCQTMTIDQIEIDLHQSYQKILSDKFDADPFDSNILQSDNRTFKEKLFQYTSDYPATLTYKFDSLRKDNIYIETSDDNNFRIYSWETGLGGTMHNFENIFQYKSGDKVYSDKATVVEGDYIPFYSQIFTLKTNDKTYYLAVYNGVYSSKDASQSIKIFSIENNLLNDTIRLIKTKKGLVNSIDVRFDFFSVSDRPERPLRLIKYDADKEIIYIPIVLENGKVTDRYILYQFKGKYFEHILTQKKSSNGK